MKALVRTLLDRALLSMGISTEREYQIERPKRPEFGHISSNIALTLARVLHRNPLQIADEIKGNLQADPDIIEKIEIAPPGFLNFFFTASYLRTIIPKVLKEEQNFGKNSLGQGKKAQVEFVSANPTGPLTVGHGRQAVLGDSIARILEWCGYEVTREYYFNNAGRQMRVLGQSTYARYMQLLGNDVPLPEDGYQGEYIYEIARNLLKEYGSEYKNDPENPIFKEYAEKWVFRLIRNTLERLNIRFDVYFNEKSLYEDGSIKHVLQSLAQKGATYEKEGAIWFKADEYGGTGHKVLWKSVVDEATYRLPDIAYHCNKLERGFDLIIDVFGADHQSTYPDVLAGLKALGYDTSSIKVIIHQFVTLTRSGEKVKMSTRKATFVTLDELIDEVGADVCRFFFLTRSANSHLNFDVDLARKQSEDNPVFYLQYAYARVASILNRAGIKRLDYNQLNLDLLKQPEELRLMEVISAFPDLVEFSHETLEPHHIVNYLHQLASIFHSFYNHHRVIVEDEGLKLARLALVKAVQTTIKNGLNILGISAPERM